MYYVTVRIGPHDFYEIVEQEQSTNADLNTDLSSHLVRISQAVRDLEGFRDFLESNVIDTYMLEALRSRQQQIQDQQLQQTHCITSIDNPNRSFDEI
ncbi:11319_t:CDS:2 [Entrophospora sp. SA101]|nr:11319_t:CDS:2 [Entrophospora sp. SA101]